jgi:hypothetical protein
MNLPRVTSILSPYADWSNIPPDVLEAACIRGTGVHEACTAHALGLFSPVPDVYRGYFDSYLRWFDAVVDDVMIVEERLSSAFGFCGQPDLVVRSKQNETLLVDLKSTLMHPRTFMLQCAAYTHLVERNYEPIKIDRAGTLHLSKEGKVPQMRWTENNREAITIFLQLLNVHNWLGR